MHKRIITLHKSIVILINCSGSVVGMTLRVPTIGTPGADQLEAHLKIYHMAVTKHIEVQFLMDSTRTRDRLGNLRFLPNM